MSAFYDQASLVVVPSGYKSGKIYAQKPLTTDGQLTFTRASTATRVNASGLIETVSSGVPRLDYLGSTCPKLLLEPQRTNSFLYSQQLNTGTSGATVTADQAVAPDGTTTADLVTGAGANNYLAKGISGAFSGTHTFSIFLKAGTDSAVGLDIYDGAYYNASYNLATGVATGTGASMVSYGNGWYRCILTRTTSANPVEVSISSIGDGLTIYAWGGQFEANASYVSSYIPTTSAAVTRLADSALDFSAVVNNTSFTFFFEGSYTFPDSNFFDLRVLTAAGYYLGFYNGFKAIYNVGSGTQFYGDSLSANANHKVLFKYDGANAKFYRDGTLLLSAAATGLGTFVDGVIHNNDQEGLKVKQFLYFPTALTDAQCVELTTL